MQIIQPRRSRRTLTEVQLAPVLDLLTVVIFFLLLSAGFVNYTKHSLPPTTTRSLPSDSNQVPANQRLLFAALPNGNIDVVVLWDGAHPGSWRKSLNVVMMQNSEVLNQVLNEAFAQMKTNSGEIKSLQVGLHQQMPYQYLMTIMDGLQTHTRDLVLLSPAEVTRMSQLLAQGDKL